MRLQAYNRRAGVSFVEVLFSVAIASVIGAALCSLLLHFSRTSTALFSYAVANGNDRLSVEIVGRDIREAKAFLQLNPTNILLWNSNNTVQLTFDSKKRQLSRIVGSNNKVLLANCDKLSFSFYERNNTALNYENLLTSSSTNCRIVQMNWVSLISSNSPGVFSVSNSVKFLNRRVL